MLNNDKPVIGNSYPHPENPNIKVTDSPAMFGRLIPDTERDGVVLQFPAEHTENTRKKIMDVVNKLERHYGPHEIYTTGIAVDPQGTVYGLNELPEEFKPLCGELEKMCRSMPQAYHQHLNLIATTNPSFLKSESGHSVVAVQSILMSQWTASSGSLAPAADNEKAILKDGDWGYFQKGAPLPKSMEDPALKIIIMPVYTAPDPSPA